MGKNCKGFNNRIGGNEKIAKALDIKEDLDINCLMYCKHCINLRHTDNKNNLKQMFQPKLACTAVSLIMCTRQNAQGGYKRKGQVLSVSGTWSDTSRRQGETTKGLVGGAGSS